MFSRYGLGALFGSFLIAIAIWSTWSAPPPVAPEGEAELSFIVIGDTPYSAPDEAMLAKALPLIRGGDFPFVLHIGDYKGGRAPCLPKYDQSFLDLVDGLAPAPVFYTPGDNEWTDCDRNKNPATGKNYSDLARLELVRQHFRRTRAPTIGIAPPANMQAQAQESQIENATWRVGAVRFATIHVTGTNNGWNWVSGDPLDDALAAVKTREMANHLWLDRAFALGEGEDARAIVLAMHADPTDVDANLLGIACHHVVADGAENCDAFSSLRKKISKLTQSFGRPVLLIHGDTKPFTLGQGFSGDEADNLWRLNAAGDGVRDVVRVDVHTNGAAHPFRAVGLITGKKTKTD